MKKYFFLLAFICVAKVSFSQQNKKNIDYQYLRAGSSYVAFKIFKDLKDNNPDKFNLNFTANAQYHKVEKILIKVGDQEKKLNFEVNDQHIISDNSDLTNYPVTIYIKDLAKIVDCTATITFKLDNGSSYSLPFFPCKYNAELAKL